MPKLPGIPHLKAYVYPPGRFGSLPFPNGQRILTIPRHNPVNAFTMAGIVRDTEMTIEEFRDLL
jgi:hypothetical protein